MSARQIHALLAYAVNNPHLISTWKDDNELQQRLGIPDSMDFEALRGFVGLATKVRHNVIRTNYPLTFRLMSVCGLEVEIFAAYAQHNSRIAAKLAINLKERAQDLIDYLSEWLDVTQLTHALLWDVVRHEHAIAELHDVASNSVYLTMKSYPADRIHAASIPSITGTLLLRELRSDPKAIEAALYAYPVRLDKITLGSRYFGYWVSPARTGVSIFELDTLGYYSLLAIDGVRDVTAIGQMLGVSGQISEGFLEPFRQLASLGLVNALSPEQWSDV